MRLCSWRWKASSTRRQTLIKIPSGGKVPRLALLFTIFLVLAGCASVTEPAVPLNLDPGQVHEGVDRYGVFYTYIPTTLPAEPEFLAVIHGTPPKEETENWNAAYYIRNWFDFSEAHGFVQIAPVYNRDDFSSRLGDHAMSGYRGLFGREIGADAWLIRLVGAHQQALGHAEALFYLYGHSAGGQFASRFIVTHPEMVKKAVITAAATYPQPDSEIGWPFGMGDLHTQIEWDLKTINRVDVLPDPETWLAATQVPLTVIVGLNDTAVLPADLIPGQKGSDRITIAGNWVNDMTAWAAAQGVESQYKFSIIPGIDHSMSRLISFSRRAMLDEAK